MARRRGGSRKKAETGVLEQVPRRQRVREGQVPLFELPVSRRDREVAYQKERQRQREEHHRRNAAAQRLLEKRQREALARRRQLKLADVAPDPVVCERRQARTEVLFARGAVGPGKKPGPKRRRRKC